jgi:hypothetical protein
MALTAAVHSTLPPVPSWDQTIVPTLRKCKSGFLLFSLSWIPYMSLLGLKQESHALEQGRLAASIQDNLPEFSSHPPIEMTLLHVVLV